MPAKIVLPENNLHQVNNKSYKGDSRVWNTTRGIGLVWADGLTPSAEALPF